MSGKDKRQIVSTQHELRWVFNFTPRPLYPCWKSLLLIKESVVSATVGVDAVNST